MTWYLAHLFSNVAIATCIAIGVGVLTRFVRNALLVYLLWLVVLVKFAIVFVPWQFVAIPAVPVTVPANSLDLYVSEPPAYRAAIEESVGTPVPSEPRKGGFLLGFLIIWPAGSLMLLTLAGWRVARFGRLLGKDGTESNELQDDAKEIAEQLHIKNCPTVRTVNSRIPPLLWSVLCPATVIFPSGLATELSSEKVNTLLAHELAHYKRRDDLCRWLQLFVLCAYWWHPVVWLAIKRLQQAEEVCCDTVVSSLFPGNIRNYCQALLETVDFLGKQSYSIHFAPSLGRLDDLQARIERIQNRPTDSAAMTWLNWLASLSALLLVLSVVAGVTINTPPSKTGNLVTNASFERAEHIEVGVPKTYGDWRGDWSKIVLTEKNVVPYVGEKMLSFLTTGSGPYTSAAQGCAVFQLVDISEHLPKVAKGNVVARFSTRFNRVNHDEQTDSQFIVYLLAMSGEPSIFPQVDNQLVYERSELITDDDITTWEEASISIVLPPETNYICVEFAAGENVANDNTMPEFDGHYADGARLELLFPPS